MDLLKYIPHRDCGFFQLEEHTEVSSDLFISIPYRDLEGLSWRLKSILAQMNGVE
jgi:hypothetical protein